MPSSSVSSLGVEIEELLRHDNLGTKTYDWIAIIWNEMAMRIGGWRFFKCNYLTTPTADTSSAYHFLSISSISVGDPVALMWVEVAANYGPITMPEYISYQHWSHLMRNNDGPTSQAAPIAWTIGPSGSDPSLGGKNAILLYPALNITTGSCNLIHAGPSTNGAPAGGDRTELPYHLEHILVWGAAAIGAKFLRPELYPLYQSEYEQGIKDAQLALTYYPDMVPSMQSIRGAYDGSIRMMAPPRTPLGQP